MAFASPSASQELNAIKTEVEFASEVMALILQTYQYSIPCIPYVL